MCYGLAGTIVVTLTGLVVNVVTETLYSSHVFFLPGSTFQEMVCHEKKGQDEVREVCGEYFTI